jgi:hypothetical protein
MEALLLTAPESRLESKQPAACGESAPALALRASAWRPLPALQSSQELSVELVSALQLVERRRAWFRSAVRRPDALGELLEEPELACESRSEHRPAAKYATSQSWS